MPKATGLTLAEAEVLLKQEGLKMSSVLNYVDTRKAKEHGIIASQSPEADAPAMLDSAVTINLYRYPTDKAETEISVNVRESEEDVNIRITLQAEGSETEIDAIQYVCPADKPRQQSVKLNLPDSRNYVCRVYQNEEVTDTIEVSNQ